MALQELIKMINLSVDCFELSIAQNYINENIDQISDNKHLLKRKSRELLEYLINQSSSIEPLNRYDFSLINSINSYEYKFDRHGLKVSVKNNIKLLLRPDIIQYLSKVAIILLEGMKVINTKKN
ncbi:hypothetical protein [Metabacillus bambusae]|uniref:Uncharacterized protein n=1 Tax=Metabacillus bambusae TaxID=2795218 RepID=A0ABS3NAJ6_9BACI|nr:hypothetical protein [Metabacillus bambusae]MBO1515066.1 hypothetical protein [Metabacillus bambusae]